jgi:hypothetical protein
MTDLMCHLAEHMTPLNTAHVMDASKDAPSPRETPSLLDLTAAPLGGQRMLHRQAWSDGEAHHLVLRGIPAAAMARLFGAVVTISFEDLVVGRRGE